MMGEKQIPQLCANKIDCCGCTACKTLCPVGAITMREEECGFPYPHIDEDKCIRCGRCLAVCGFKQDAVATESPTEVKIFALRAKDDEVVCRSSSGGAFTVISDWVLEQHGAIASAVYDYSSHILRYQLYTDKQTRDAARGSKYVHPVMGDIFDRCVEWMLQHPERPLLFVGLGCQTAGFRRVVDAKGLSDQAILIDLICHGTPSAQLWQDYIDLLEKKNGAPVEYITFKDKRNGWENPYAHAKVGGKEIPLDAYSCWFYENYSQRDSCFHCPYTKLKRNSDITIGDFWGIKEALPEFYSDRGNSLLLIQTQRGAELFEKIRDKVWYAESDSVNCMQPRLQTPGTENRRRPQFWKDYQKKGIPYLERHYREDGKLVLYLKRSLGRVKRVLRRLLGRSA